MLIESRCKNSFDACKTYTRVPIGSKMILPMVAIGGIVPSAVWGAVNFQKLPVEPWTHFVMLHGSCDTNNDGSLESRIHKGLG